MVLPCGVTDLDLQAKACRWRGDPSIRKEGGSTIDLSRKWSTRWWHVYAAARQDSVRPVGRDPDAAFRTALDDHVRPGGPTVRSRDHRSALRSHRRTVGPGHRTDNEGLGLGLERMRGPFHLHVLLVAPSVRGTTLARRVADELQVCATPVRFVPQLQPAVCDPQPGPAQLGRAAAVPPEEQQAPGQPFGCTLDEWLCRVGGDDFHLPAE